MALPICAASPTDTRQRPFDAAFIEEQAAAISAALIATDATATPEAVAATIRNDQCGPRWLGGALQRVRLEMPGRGAETQQMPGAFAIGMEPTRVRDAVRTHWREPEQGLATVRTYRERHPPRAARH